MVEVNFNGFQRNINLLSNQNGGEKDFDLP